MSISKIGNLFIESSAKYIKKYHIDFSEEFAELLTRMAISYEKDAEAQGQRHMGGAFLNGYQTAVFHILQQLNQTPQVEYMLLEYLTDLMKAFVILAHRGGVQPNLNITI